jgi:hypothetical protein
MKLEEASLRCALSPGSLALGNDGLAKAPAKLLRQFVGLGFTPIDLYGHLGGVTYHITVVAPLKMVFEFSFGLGVHCPVKVVG